MKQLTIGAVSLRSPIAHRWGVVEGTKCCVCCYCEPDWPLASQPCPDRDAARDMRAPADPKRSSIVKAVAARKLQEKIASVNPNEPPPWWSNAELHAKYVAGLKVTVRGKLKTRRIISAFGVELPPRLWAEITGLCKHAIDARYRAGWPHEAIVGVPAAPNARTKDRRL